MPIYEYVCEKCGSQIEVMQKVTDEPLKRCRSCRGKLEKVISRTSFHLKGSGWYLTDYARSSPAKGKEKADKADKEAKNGKSGASAEPTCGAGACGACE